MCYSQTGRQKDGNVLGKKDNFWQFFLITSGFGNFLTFRWQFSGGSGHHHKVKVYLSPAVLANVTSVSPINTFSSQAVNTLVMELETAEPETPDTPGTPVTFVEECSCNTFNNVGGTSYTEVSLLPPNLGHIYPKSDKDFLRPVFSTF